MISKSEICVSVQPIESLKWPLNLFLKKIKTNRYQMILLLFTMQVKITVSLKHG